MWLSLIENLVKCLNLSIIELIKIELEIIVFSIIFWLTYNSTLQLVIFLKWVYFQLSYFFFSCLLNELCLYIYCKCMNLSHFIILICDFILMNYTVWILLERMVKLMSLWSHILNMGKYIICYSIYVMNINITLLNIYNVSNGMRMTHVWCSCLY